MKKLIAITLLMFIFTSFSMLQVKAPCLCEQGEDNLFSFETKKSKKVMSICIGPEESYIQYRFGLPGKIELQFPEERNADSWKQFEYSGYHRGGGPKNAGLDTYSLFFYNQETGYEVYYNAAYADTTEESYYQNCGIRISSAKSYDIKGDIESYSGYLGGLMYNDKIPQE